MSKSTRQTPTTLTLEEVAADVITMLDEEQREELRTSDLPAFAYHRTLGMFIRNRYIYDNELTIDFGDELPLWHPDGLSHQVVKRVLGRLRRST